MLPALSTQCCKPDERFAHAFEDGRRPVGKLGARSCRRCRTSALPSSTMTSAITPQTASEMCPALGPRPRESLHPLTAIRARPETGSPLWRSERGGQRVAHALGIFERAPGAERDAGKRVVGDGHRQARSDRAAPDRDWRAARRRRSARCPCRRCRRRVRAASNSSATFTASTMALDRLGQRFGDMALGDGDFLRHAVQQIAALDLHRGIAVAVRRAAARSRFPS